MFVHDIGEIKNGRLITKDELTIKKDVLGRPVLDSPEGTPEEARIKILERNIEAAKRSSDMESAKELQQELDDLRAEIARKTSDGLLESVEEFSGLAQQAQDSALDFDLRDIEKETINNHNFLKVLYTDNIQLTLMCLKPGEDIGEEIHSVDQFFRFDKGSGKVIVNDNELLIEDGFSVIVAAGARHNIINTSQDELQFYTIYGRPIHEDGEIFKTREEAYAKKTRTVDGGPGSGIKGHVTPEEKRGLYMTMAGARKEGKPFIWRIGHGFGSRYFATNTKEEANNKFVGISQLVSGNSDTKDGGPGSGQKGHVTARQNKLNFVQNKLMELGKSLEDNKRQIKLRATTPAMKKKLEKSNCFARSDYK